MFFERFEELLKVKKVTIAEVARETGIPYTTLDSIIKKQQNNTSIENVSKLAEYFGVTMEWLATGKELEPELSPNKKRAIEIISTMEPAELRAVLAFLRSLQDTEE